MNTIHPDDISHIKHLVERKNKGMMVNSQEVTDLYNKVLEKSVSNTTCSSCVRRRIQELQDHLEKYENECLTKLVEVVEEVFDDIKEEEEKEDATTEEHTKRQNTTRRKNKKTDR